MISVYCIVTLPAERPVTRPLEFTVAIVVFSEIHGFVADGVPDPIKVVVKLTQTLLAPVIVGVENCALTMKLLLVFDVHEPLFVVMVYVVP